MPSEKAMNILDNPGADNGSLHNYAAMVYLEASILPTMTIFYPSNFVFAHPYLNGRPQNQCMGTERGCGLRD